jgi:hypothetical protein
LYVKPELEFLVTFEEMPAEVVRNQATLLPQAVRNSAMRHNGTVTAQADIVQDGYPAKEYEIDCGETVFQGRYILAGLRLYNVCALVSKKTGPPYPQEVKSFIDSFQVLK